MTQIYIVRHPESAMNKRRDLVGGRSVETPLTDRGIEQAHRFGEAFLSTYGMPDMFISSPAVRTESLIKIIQQDADIPNQFSVSSSLHEMSHGAFEGKDRNETYNEKIIDQIKREQLDFKLPGGQSMNDVGHMVIDWMKRIHTYSPDTMTLAAGHGMSTRCVVGILSRWSHDQIMATISEFDNVSLSSFTVSDDGICVNFYGKDIIEPVPMDWRS